jgi:fibrillarin-like pre-rRNA processing protein
LKEIFGGVYHADGAIATKSLAPGKKVYNERLVKTREGEFRIWNPYRSKLCAALKNGLKTFPFKKGSKILYLGASTGTTVSHVSDILGKSGEIYAVEIAPRAMKSLLKVAEDRENIIPIHGDARKPQDYEDVGKVEIIYQDVAQPDQDEILLKNARMFLRKGGIAMIAIKSQSIDVTLEPKRVFEKVVAYLEKHFNVLEKIRLEPYDKDHLFVVLEFKG